jgi:hypothetical protein
MSIYRRQVRIPEVLFFETRHLLVRGIGEMHDPAQPRPNLFKQVSS